MDAWQKNARTETGEHLLPELFWFKREVAGDKEGKEHLERNLLKPMPWIVTSAGPLVTAAQVNTRVEFDRTFRTIVYVAFSLVDASGLCALVGGVQVLL